jgi:hypothetical protein
MDADTREPLTAGKVIVNGNYSAMFSLNDDGSRDPQSVNRQVRAGAIVYGIGTVLRTVELDETDVTIELTIKP